MSSEPDYVVCFYCGDTIPNHFIPIGIHKMTDRHKANVANAKVREGEK